jgi:hypothetical protein
MVFTTDMFTVPVVGSTKGDEVVEEEGEGKEGTGRKVDT